MDKYYAVLSPSEKNALEGIFTCLRSSLPFVSFPPRDPALIHFSPMGLTSILPNKPLLKVVSLVFLFSLSLDLLFPMIGPPVFPLSRSVPAHFLRDFPVYVSRNRMNVQ